MATYAIGDVQGCYDQLQRLLARLDFDERRDTLWFCGDLVNRGPKSLKTLRFIRELGDSAISVLGNHDLSLIEQVRAGHRPRNGTLHSIFTASDRDELIDWLAALPFCHIDKKRRAVLVHAGVPPGWTPRQLAKRAAKLHSHWYAALHDSLRASPPRQWHRDLDPQKKLRYTLAALTRMRYVEADGRLNFALKGGPSGKPDGLYPWYDFLHKAWHDYRIYFGHWSTLRETGLDNVIALDTGCVWGGRLSAVRVTKKGGKAPRYTCVQCNELRAQDSA